MRFSSSIIHERLAAVGSEVSNNLSFGAKGGSFLNFSQNIVNKKKYEKIIKILTQKFRLKLLEIVGQRLKYIINLNQKNYHFLIRLYHKKSLFIFS